MPSVAFGVLIFMSPVLATRLATKAAVPTATLKVAALLAPPFLIDECVHHDARIGRQAEGGLIVEGDAECRIGPVTSMSCSKIGSSTRSAATFPGLPRVTVALPCTVATCPTSPVGLIRRRPLGRRGCSILRTRGKRPKHAAGDVHTTPNFLMKSRRFQLRPLEGIPTGTAGQE